MDKPEKKLGSHQLCETGKTEENHRAYTNTKILLFLFVE